MRAFLNPLTNPIYHFNTVIKDLAPKFLENILYFSSAFFTQSWVKLIYQANDLKDTSLTFGSKQMMSINDNPHYTTLLIDSTLHQKLHSPARLTNDLYGNYSQVNLKPTLVNELKCRKVFDEE